MCFTMKKTSISLGLICASLFFAFTLRAQQQASKSKSSVKLYEKSGILRDVDLENAEGVNSERLDFSPTFYQNGIVFVSQHKNGPVDRGMKAGKDDVKQFFDLFFSEMDEEGHLQKPREFSISVNSQKHEGPVSFSRDGELMYFTRNNLKSSIPQADERGRVVVKIYEARRGELDWEDIRELPFNSDDFSCFHPSLSKDGKRLFFASNMRGGYGGYDLYYSDKKGDKWSKPVNLGADVNTKNDEAFPFYHESGTLFFSSKGHPGRGKMDIFMIDISGEKWGKVINLGTPYNSAKDDLGFILNPEGTLGYLASDRPGGKGSDDIYRFKAPIPIIRTEEATLDGQVIAYDAQTNERLPNASVRVFERTSDGFMEGNDLYDVELLPSANGELLMKLVRKNETELAEATLFTDLNGVAKVDMKQGKSYIVLVSKDGYESAEMMHVTDNTLGNQIVRVPMKANSCTSLAGVVSVNGFKTGVPNAVVTVFNKTTGEEENLRSNGSGRFNYCLAPDCDYLVSASKEGYSAGNVSLSTKEVKVANLAVTVRLEPPSDANEVEVKEIVSEPIRKGSVILLENIYYDFDKYFIRNGDAEELDALAQLMKQYPSMEIELIAHTDSRGDEDYNLDLSVKRAESAKRYLIGKGIADYRVEAFGYGESEIRNHCKNGVDCSDEEHQFNRRTEVKVVRIDEPVQVEYGEGKPFGNE